MLAIICLTILTIVRPDDDHDPFFIIIMFELLLEAMIIGAFLFPA